VAIALRDRLFIGGHWVGGGEPLEVRNKYTGEVIATLPTARREDVEAAVQAAVVAAEGMAQLPAYKRADILARAAGELRARREEIARLIAAEAGKALKYARVEVDRAINTFTFAAEEAKRIHGERCRWMPCRKGRGTSGSTSGARWGWWRLSRRSTSP
jgi:acyl-CoA reductase-like NAD-dependent aldehyde dehydrogenase